MESTATTNYYEILEVPTYASQSDIQYAYEKARSTYSLENPDIYKVFSAAEAQSWMQMIEEAFRVIGHPQSREIYNQELSERRRVVPADLKEFTPENKTPLAQPVIDKPASIDSASELPSGMGRTVLSTYQIDPHIEGLIDNEEVFDGLFLKKIRTYKNVEQQDFSKKTCIALRHIYAIENNNFAVLPAAVFVRGYIIQYCRILNLDEHRVTPSFMSLLANEKNTSQ